MFGGGSTGAFNTTTTTQPTTGAFGAFGQQQPTTGTTTGTGIFGGGSAFAQPQQQQQQPSAFGAFGQSQQQQQQQPAASTGTSIFGGTSAFGPKPATGFGSTFGQSSRCLVTMILFLNSLCSTQDGGAFGSTSTTSPFGQPAAQPAAGTNIFVQPQQQQTSTAFGTIGSFESKGLFTDVSLRCDYHKALDIWSTKSANRNNHWFRHHWSIRRSASDSTYATCNRSLRNNSKYRYQHFRTTTTAPAATTRTTNGRL